MITAADLTGHLTRPAPPEPAETSAGLPADGLTTGLGELDRLLTSLRPGQVWVVLSDPGAGRSTLVTQLAGRWARRGVRVGLVSARDPERVVAARLVAAAAHVSLRRVLGDSPGEGTAEQRERVEDAVAAVSRAPLTFGRTARDLTVMGEGADVLVVDDADLFAVPALDVAEDLRAWVGTRRAVVLAVPAALVLHGRAGRGVLDHRWARVADVVIDIRRHDQDPGRPAREGEADLVVLQHRTGPLACAVVAFHGWGARFADLQDASLGGD